MAVAKLTCPDCGAGLNPAKMPDPGKKVKCPRCANIFKVPDPDEDEAPRKKPAAKKAAPAVTKAPAKSPAKAAPKPSSPNKGDEDDDKGTYGFKMTEEEEEEAAEKNPKIDYAPDLSVKDPRGPASAIVLPPSNWMLRHGSAMFFIGLFLFAYGLWPFVFSEFLVDPTYGRFYVKAVEDKKKEEEQKVQKAAEKGMVYTPPAVIRIDPQAIKIDREAFMEPMTLEELEKDHPDAYKYWKGLCDDKQSEQLKALFGGIVQALFGAALCFASVQLQKLESYTWAMIAVGICIVTGLATLIVGVLIGTNIEGDDVFLEQYASIGFGVSWGLGAIAVGALTFVKLRDPKVVEAFEFVPE